MGFKLIVPGQYTTPANATGKLAKTLASGLVASQVRCSTPPIFQLFPEAQLTA